MNQPATERWMMYGSYIVLISVSDDRLHSNTLHDLGVITVTVIAHKIELFDTRTFRRFNVFGSDANKFNCD